MSAGISSSLQRVTSSGRFIPVVDGLRFLAILSVVLYHLNGYVLARSEAFDRAEAKQGLVQQVLDCGHCGVKLFFVISAFILGLPFAEHYLAGRPKPTLGKYLSRRFLRIAPPCAINLCVVFLMLVAVAPGNFTKLLPHLGASLIYLHNLVFGQHSRINGVAWSLEVEVQFYLLAPFVAMVFALRRPLARRGLLLAGILLWIAARMAVPEWRQQLAGSILWYADFFLAGFLLADVYVDAWKEQPSRHWAWDLVAGAAACTVVAAHFHPATQHTTSLLILVAYAAAFRSTLLHRCLCQRWVAIVGGMCYTIYLYHFFMISAIGRWTIKVPFGPAYWSNVLFQALVIVPPLLALSAVLFLACERPFMVRDWPARWRSALLAAVGRNADMGERVPQSPTA